MLVSLVPAPTQWTHYALQHNIGRYSGTEDAEIDRAIFLQLAQMAREESRVITDLALKLRFCKQTRLNSVTAENARKRLHNGPKPWEVIVGGASDDDDDDDQGPATTN
jgi:hypothetical protein